MGLNIAKFKLITLFTMLMLTVTSSSQAQQSPTQADWFSCRHSLLATIIDFERYRNGLGDPGLDTRLKGHLTTFRHQFDALIAPDSSLSEPLRKQLKQQWQLVGRRLGAWLVTLQQGGFIDQEITYQYQEQMTEFWKQLNSPTLSPGQTTPIQRLILLLQQSNLRYLDPSWRLAPYNNLDLTALTTLTDRELAKSDLNDKNIQRKWPLLRQALLREDRSMGFIVNRYSNDLVDQLLRQPDTTAF